MKKIELMLILVLSCTQGFSQTKEGSTTEADEFWKTMPSFIPWGSFQGKAIDTINEVPIYAKSEADLLRQFYFKQEISYELFARYLREWGIVFWEKFPTDPRRFEWFKMTTVYYPPRYFADISEGARMMGQIRKNNGVVSIDTVARDIWKSQYVKFRNEFLTSTEVTDKDKEELLHSELDYPLKYHWRAKVSDKPDFKDWFEKANYFVNKYIPNLKDANQNISSRLLMSMASSFFQQKDDYGLNEDDLKLIIDLFEHSESMVFKRFSTQMKTLLKLQEEPLQMVAKTYKGSAFNLKDYRGKLVLVDFWTLGCSGCIAKMPEIARVYQQYKSKGFEVISACFIVGKNSSGEEIYKNEKDKIKEVYNKVGANWPMIYLERTPGEKKNIIWETYGFVGVPQLMLLDESGRLIHYNGDLLFSKGGLERLVEDHFKNKN
ncbi:TlpA disulfide reductase family protein [Pedobacter frigoris]|uniref:peroxiredoxin family protein n=1 Tax=Pedobacter frigoris TaxID=2571272 RepID=UPI00292EF5CC|nr:TlpA disulfide reductase family protein [Pedobacter frigoris]